MSTLSNRPNTAVLVIDVQNGVVANGHNRDDVVANINEVVTKARAADVPVVWIQHDAVGSLVVTGAQTDACVRSTLHGAVARGYDALLVGDAHTTDDLSEYGMPPADKVIAHTNMYWQYQSAPGRTMGTVETKDVEFTGVA
jgi:nicotinamidase-related amidase